MRLNIHQYRQTICDDDNDKTPHNQRILPKDIQAQRHSVVECEMRE